ncbi:MAG: helix-turn-helix transcriptional regulator [Sporichthyaceae bacterium]|nr:helix-turn-helix transcriptional regulator [Sporichthyaceae bacterium]
MSAYGQFCPVAKAMELLDERWTMLVVRELLAGSSHFNDLRRGVPRMSPTLLSRRLRTLIRAGVVERQYDGNRTSYALTEAGQELGPIVNALGTWGMRWVPELGDEDLDPHLLMWDIRRSIDPDAASNGRTVLRFTFPMLRTNAKDWWVVVDPNGVGLCDFDPGFPVAVTVEADLRTLTKVWRGDLAWRAAVKSGGLTLHGPSALRRAVPEWLKLSGFADVPRPALAS